MAYEVTLEVFQGPLDLLLHLITRQRVDIYDVSLSTITEEYVSAMEAMGDLDLETATGFLVIAATLLELKSARLLPRTGDDDAASKLLEERDLLLARLVECATFRTAGAWIAAALKEGDAFHGRAVSLEERFVDLAPDLLARVKIGDLGRAAALVFAPKPVIELDTSHVSPIKASVKDAIAELASTLERGEALSFRELCGFQTERIEIVVRFLALLELFKAGAIDLEQATRFGDITASWTGEVGAEEVLAEAEEYTVAEPAIDRAAIDRGGTEHMNERKIIESILLLADEPVPASLIGEVLEVSKATVVATLQGLAESYHADERGFLLRETAEGWRLYSDPACDPWLERFVISHTNTRLTAAALEVLAIVAYRQPISRAQIGEIRGVDSDGVVKTLEQRGLLVEAGRDPGPGSPVMFTVSPGFLERMGLRSTDELPPLADFMPDTEAVEDMEAKLSPNA